MQILYLCNGKNKDCRKKSCYKYDKSIGACKHTSNIDYAKNFENTKKKYEDIEKIFGINNNQGIYVELEQDCNEMSQKKYKKEEFLRRITTYAASATTFILLVALVINVIS